MIPFQGVILKSRDPDKLCSQWELALGTKRDPGEIFNISLDQSNISFVHDKNSIEDGIHAFIVKALNREKIIENAKLKGLLVNEEITVCLLYTSPSPRDGLLSRMPSSA